MAIKYLDSKRIRGIASEKAALAGTHAGLSGTTTGWGSNGNTVWVSKASTQTSVGDKISKIGCRYHATNNQPIGTKFVAYKGTSTAPTTFLCMTESAELSGTDWIDYDVVNSSGVVEAYTIQSGEEGYLWVGNWADDSSYVYVDLVSAGVKQMTMTYNASNTAEPTGTYSVDTTHNATITARATIASALPENTLFDETDTQKIYWLQENEWRDADWTAPFANSYSEDFDFADQAAADASYVPNSSYTANRVDVSADNLGFYFRSEDAGSNGANNRSVSHDMGEVLGNRWTIKFKMVISDWTANANYTCQAGIGMYSKNEEAASDNGSLPSSNDCDGIVMGMMAQQAAQRWTTQGQSDSHTWGGGTQPENSSGNTETPSTGTYYVTLRRLSETEADCRIATSSDYTGGLYTDNLGTISSSISGLRYFGIKNNTSMDSSPHVTLQVDDLLIEWDSA